MNYRRARNLQELRFSDDLGGPLVASPPRGTPIVSVPKANVLYATPPTTPYKALPTTAIAGSVSTKPGVLYGTPPAAGSAAATYKPAVIGTPQTSGALPGTLIGAGVTGGAIAGGGGLLTARPPSGGYGTSQDPSLSPPQPGGTEADPSAGDPLPDGSTPDTAAAPDGGAAIADTGLFGTGISTQTALLAAAGALGVYFLLGD